MKTAKVSFIAILLTTAFSFASTPGGGRFGAGIVFGAPTGLTGKYWVTNLEAVDFGVNFWSYGGTLLYGDFHWNFPHLFISNTQFVRQLSPYAGIGGGLAFWSGRTSCGRWACNSVADSGTGFFVRIPIGVEWYPGQPPLGVFVELVPALTVLPGTTGFLDAGIGIRYYF